MIKQNFHVKFQHRNRINELEVLQHLRMQNTQNSDFLSLVVDVGLSAREEGFLLWFLDLVTVLSVLRDSNFRHY